MFMDWKNQYSENEYNTQSNLRIQWNPYQATAGVQPQLIQGVRSGDSVGEDQETIVSIRY